MTMLPFDIEPTIDDTVHHCPLCETINQFGELCPDCESSQDQEADECGL